jgi:Rrf2 family transcriptional regulator, iron-sulfur cluster assembly transcription factor
MLSVTSKYALRALTHLAALPEGESMLGKDLSKRADIPANYLSKILWMLGSAGLIDATRGSRGGYRLRRKDDTIFLFEVVDLFDRTRIAPTCFLGEDRICSDEDACSAHALWREVRNVYTNFLQSTSLADIARAGPPVRKRIEASKARPARRRRAGRRSRP